MIKQVLESSESDTWKSAVTEWEIYDVEEDEKQLESCICGKENLRYLYTIRNKLNDNQLYPIGSQCIKKFNQEDLTDEINVKEQMFKLLHAVEDNAFLKLSSDFFSRKLSEKQDKKATAIILNSIKPFLQAQLAEKVRK